MLHRSLDLFLCVHQYTLKTKTKISFFSSYKHNIMAYAPAHQNLFKFWRFFRKQKFFTFFTVRLYFEFFQFSHSSVELVKITSKRMSMGCLEQIETITDIQLWHTVAKQYSSCVRVDVVICYEQHEPMRAYVYVLLTQLLHPNIHYFIFFYFV